MYKPSHWKESIKWEAPAYPFFASVFIPLSLPVDKPYFHQWSDHFDYFNDGKVIQLKPLSDMCDIGQLEIEELLQGKTDFIDLIKKLHKEINAAIDTCQNGDFEIEDLSSWWKPVQRSLTDVASVLFPFDVSAERYFKNMASDDPELAELLTGSILAKTKSLMSESNDFLLDLVEEYPDNFGKVYELFKERYSWFQNSYAGVFKFDEAWLQNYAKSVHRIPKEEARDKELVYPDKYKNLVEACNIALNFRDDKKKLLMVGVVPMEKWLHKVCDKYHYDYSEMLWITLDEILYLTEKNETIYLEKAKKYASEKLRYGIMKFPGYKDVGKDFADAIVATQLPEGDTTIIKGVVASKGFAKGKVKVIIDVAKDSHKMEQGDILVTSMTKPEYLPLMNLAAAFVTDEGGISCHAAIISREMGKPCIIGTRYATRVFKDGDIVEVDANDGFVRKI